MIKHLQRFAGTKSRVSCSTISTIEQTDQSSHTVHALNDQFGSTALLFESYTFYCHSSFSLSPLSFYIYISLPPFRFFFLPCSPFPSHCSFFLSLDCSAREVRVPCARKLVYRATKIERNDRPSYSESLVIRTATRMRCSFPYELFGTICHELNIVGAFYGSTSLEYKSTYRYPLADVRVTFARI